MKKSNVKKILQIIDEETLKANVKQRFILKLKHWKNIIYQRYFLVAVNSLNHIFLGVITVTGLSNALNTSRACVVSVVAFVGSNVLLVNSVTIMNEFWLEIKIRIWLCGEL